jgi:hypothetical protein
MISRLAMAMFVLGSAVGVGAMYMTEQWRTARASKSTTDTASGSGREIAPTDLDALPSELALREIYERVSHA